MLPFHSRQEQQQHLHSPSLGGGGDGGRGQTLRRKQWCASVVGIHDRLAVDNPSDDHNHDDSAAG